MKDQEARKQFLEDAKDLNLSLTQIKRQIQQLEQQSKPTTSSIKDLAEVKGFYTR